MGTVNRMSNLLDKIERRLGVRFIIEKGDERLNKDAWVDVILQDTMDTFSRYFPDKFRIVLDSEACRRINDYYVINEEILDPIDIIGIGDIDWSANYMNNQFNSITGGIYDPYSNPMGIYDIALAQTALNGNSFLTYGIFLEFQEPNMLKVKGIQHNDVMSRLKGLPLNVFIKHKSLITISPTKMELFERLAICDVARYILGEIKYFDGYETNFGNIDFKLDDLRVEAEKREGIIEDLEAGYVNPANRNQPMIMTI